MPIVINLEIPGADKVATKFDTVIEKLETIDAKYKQVGQGFSAGQGARAASAARQHTGIYSKLAEAKERLNNATLKGIDLEIKDARAAVFAAQKRVESHERRVKMETSGVPDWMATSRLAIGPNGKLQLMPLLNRMIESGQLGGTGGVGGILNLSGMGGGIGSVGQGFAASMPGLAKVGIGLAGAGAAFMAIKAAADAFSRATKPFTQTHWTGGGTSQQTGAAVALGAALGMDTGSMGDRAVSLSERLLHGGYGASYMRSKGVTGAGWWRANQTGTYLRALDELRNIQDDEEAIRVARDLGLQDELRVRDLSPGTYQSLRRSSSAAGSRESRRAAAEYDANKAIISRTLQDWWVSGTKPLMESFNQGAQDLRDVGKMNWHDATIGGWKRFATAKGWKEFFSGDTTPWLEATRERLSKESGGSGKGQVEATKALTRALKDATDAINLGSRSGQAVPAAWRNRMLEEALHNQAMALGSWTV